MPVDQASKYTNEIINLISKAVGVKEGSRRKLVRSRLMWVSVPASPRASGIKRRATTWISDDICYHPRYNNQANVQLNFVLVAASTNQMCCSDFC